MQIRCSNCFTEYEESWGLCPNCGYVEGEQYSEMYSLTPGTRIMDRYIIGMVLGMGGFGITYKAWDIQLNTVLAIKEYFPSGLVNRTAPNPEVFLVATKQEDAFINGKRRFLDEARNMAKFSKHHNIVNVFNYFEANNTVYIVMEYLDGLTLSETLQAENQPLPVDRCISIAMDVCDALESIHKEDILHRDVSPDNIMLCKDGTIKLFDFGAARFSMDAADNNNISVIVKRGFAPPEQYSNINRQDARTDLYALGATLYYALTGVKPEESTDRMVGDTMQPPKSYVPSIPDYLNNAVMRAMSLEAQFRFESAEEFRKILQMKIPVSSLATERKKRVRRRFLGIFGAFAVIAAIAAGAWLTWMQRQAESILPDGNIELWYMTSGNAEADQTELEAWKTVTDLFVQEYSNVTVTVTGIPEAEYVEKLAQAQKAGTLPHIFESTAVPASMLHDTQSVSGLLADSRGLYLDGLSGRDNQYPTGLLVPVIYVNTSMGTIRESKDFIQIIAACEDYGSVPAISKASAELYKQLYGSNVDQYVSDTALEQFLSGKCILYFGTSADYLLIQEGLMRKGVGTYSILLPEVAASVYSYGCLWSCAQNDPDTTEISHALLTYLNSDLGQDYFNIRNFSCSGTLPVTRSGMEKYIDSYVELSGIFDYMDLPYAE